MSKDMRQMIDVFALMEQARIGRQIALATGSMPRGPMPVFMVLDVMARAPNPFDQPSYAPPPRRVPQPVHVVVDVRLHVDGGDGATGE